MNKYDVVIIGGGTNALAAAIYLQSKGLETIIFEKEQRIGGATKTEELTSPGYQHDVGSAVLPMAYSSPFFSQLPLENFGLEWIFPEIPFAQTLREFDDFAAIACYKDINDTAAQLGADEKAYKKFMNGLVQDWPLISEDILGPLGIPKKPIKFLKFGLHAILSARGFTSLKFQTERSKALFYGAAAHSTLALNSPASASFGLVLSTMAHINGWPIPKYGAGKFVEALQNYYHHIGGEVHTGFEVRNLKQIPDSKVRMFDLTPRQILELEGLDLSGIYRKRLSNFEYGAGVFKMDWALSEPIPFRNEILRKAGTVHVGFGSDEIFRSEALIHKNQISNQPYVLLVQPSIFDHTRTPDRGHTAWAYCHVPHASKLDCREMIENQIERAAPGFKKVITKRHSMNSVQLESFDANLIGGDINGGKQNIKQLFTRPVVKLSPYKTSSEYHYICSSSTPPGGGVHGMCGYNAARKVWKDHFC